MHFVSLAAEKGFEYAWADTCCINKESDAELSEAVNSMYKVSGPMKRSLCLV